MLRDVLERLDQQNCTFLLELDQVMQERGFQEGTHVQWRRSFPGMKDPPKGLAVAARATNWVTVNPDHDDSSSGISLAAAGVLLDPQTRALNPRFFIGAAWPAEEDPAEGWYDWIFVDWPHMVLRSPSFFHFQTEHGESWNPEQGWVEDRIICFRTRMDFEHAPAIAKSGLLVATSFDVTSDLENVVRVADRLGELGEQ